ncbi:MAG: ABC transporter ATP-binding protein [Acidimicrobiales bacterium]
MNGVQAPSDPVPALRVRGLSVNYGGHLALDGIDLDVPLSRLTGLIGPNGAGKTTTFNACTGLVQSSAGKVTLLGRDITDTNAPQRGRLGLGRTFQRMELFDRLTVTDNLTVAAEAGMVGRRRFFGPIFATRRETAAVAEATAEAAELCGVGRFANRLAGTLSTGQRRLVELARALAADFQVLLLDEPSSGLDAAETRQFAAILKQVVLNRDTAILLVEHDMSLIREVCEYTYVLDFGKLVTEGRTDEVLSSDLVRAVYLGSEAS